MVGGLLLVSVQATADGVEDVALGQDAEALAVRVVHDRRGLGGRRAKPDVEGDRKADGGRPEQEPTPGVARQAVDHCEVPGGR